MAKKQRSRRKPVNVEKFALLLRNNMTKAEQRFWMVLKKEQRKWKHRFEPQVVVYGYIPDFYCKTLQLAVEIDGCIHKRKRVRQKDQIRTRYLNSMGVTVIRFKNYQVFGELSNLIRILQEVST